MLFICPFLRKINLDEFIQSVDFIQFLLPYKPKNIAMHNNNT